MKRIQRRLFGHIIIIIITLTAGSNRPVVAQASESHQDIRVLLDKQDKLSSMRSMQEKQLAELERQSSADPHAVLRSEIQSHQDFLIDLQRVHEKAPRFSMSPLIDTFGWNIAYVTSRIGVLKATLAQHERARAGDAEMLRKQIEDQRQAIDLTAKLQQALASTIDAIRHQARLEASAAGLGALEFVSTPKPAPSIGGVIINNLPIVPPTAADPTRPAATPGSLHQRPRTEEGVRK